MPCTFQEQPINVKTKITDPRILSEALDDLNLKYRKTGDKFTILAGRYDSLKGRRIDNLTMERADDGTYTIQGDPDDIEIALPIITKAYAAAAIRAETAAWGGDILDSNPVGDEIEMRLRVGGRNARQVVTVRIAADGSVTGVVDGQDLDVCNPLVHGINHRVGAQEADHEHDWADMGHQKQQFVGGAGDEDTDDNPLAGDDWSGGW